MSTERTLNGTKLLASVPEERIAVLDGLCRWRSFEQDDVILNLDDDSTDH